jgi:hypothetical protein
MSTNMTVGEVLVAVQRHREKQAVFEELIEFLNRFIPSDAYQPKDGIASPITHDVIGPDILDEVKDELFVMKIRAETDVLEMTGKPVSGLVKKKAPRKKAGTKKKAPRKKAPSRRRTTRGKE